MSRQVFLNTFSRYLPEKSLHYCLKLWEEKPFDITITPKRTTKLGDYSYCPRKKKHKITVNGDLNPFSFLVTYIHEVAHFRTYTTFGFKVKPHGREWKNQFSSLMAPMLEKKVFPEEMMPALLNYFSNPKASSCSDLDLLKALRSIDNNSGKVFLGELGPGVSFRFNARQFVLEKKRRTRSLCQDVKTGKKYLISDGAQVELVSGQAAHDMS